jgi:hypothetical protein
MATPYIYNQAQVNLMKGLINDLSDAATTIKVALLADTYIPDQVNDDNWADVMANEISGTGYTAGGQEVSTKTISDVSGVATFDGDNILWASSTLTARYVVIYDDTPAADADKKLIGFIDYGENKQSTGGDWEIQWNVGGIWIISTTQMV